MRRSDRAVGIFPPSVPSLPNLCAEVGKLQPAPLLGVPNLPNLPILAPRVCVPVRVRGRGGAHTPPRVHACAQDEKRLGRLGRLGTGSGCKASGFPTSVLRLGRLGIKAGKREAAVTWKR